MARFVVREVDGYSITARGIASVQQGSRKRPMLSVSVLDSAYCFEEMARFRQEDEPRGQGTYEGRRSWVRAKARTEADRLERLHRWAR